MVAVIEIIVLVVLLAAVGGRLLGVRLPLVRAVLAGLAGVAAGVVFGYLVYARDRNHVTPQVVGAGVLAAVVAMMVVMVLAELLARPSRHDLVPGGLPHPWRALRRMAQSTRRSAQLTRSRPGTGSRPRPLGGPIPPSWPAGCGRRWKRPARSSSSSAKCCPPGPTCCPRR